MGDYINTVDLLGDEVLTKQILEGTFDGVFVSDHFVGQFSHYSMYNLGYLPNLTKVILPAVTTFHTYDSNPSGYIFSYTGLKVFDYAESVPNHSSSQTYVSARLFAYCYDLERVVLPDYIDTIKQSAFYYCRSLTNINLNNITNINNQSFYYCYSLTEIELPKIQTIAAYAISYCYCLHHMVIGSETNHTDNSIQISSNNNSIRVNVLKTFTEDVSSVNICWCNNLLLASATAISSIASLNKTRRLVIYQNESVCSLSGSGINSIEEIYVPDELVEEYKTATNWSVWEENIFPLSEFSETLLSPSYIQDSWTAICNNIDNNNYAQYLGKKKFLLIPNIGWAYAVCIALDRDMKENNDENAKTTWFLEDGVGQLKRMNPDLSSNNVGTGAVGGYQFSEMRSYMGEIYNILNSEESELHNKIVPVKKYSYVYMDEMGNVVSNKHKESVEYCWLASAGEIFGNSFGYEDQGVTYTDYFINNSKRKKYSLDTNGSWWLRTTDSYQRYWKYVTNSGGMTGDYGREAKGVVFGFCIG